MFRAGLVSLAVVLAMSVTARPADAQGAPAAPRFSIAGGYAFLQEMETGTLPATAYEAGWAAQGGIRFGATRLSGVGEAGISTHVTQFQERQQLFGVLGGARVDLFRWSRMTVYAQGLVGMERFSEPGYAVWGVAVQPGGGADIRLWSNVIARVQADYRMSVEDGDTFHVVRFFGGAGVTWR